MQKLLAYLTKRYSFSLSKMAFLRIVIGVICMLDIIIRMQDVTAHYTNLGVLPTHLVVDKPMWLFQSYFIFDYPQGQLLIFSIHLFFAILLVVGLFPRLASFVCWIMLSSLIARNIYITQGGDDMLRIVLFWGMFLPWGKSYSLQKLWFNKKQVEEEDAFFSLPALALLLQVAYLYFFSAFLKTGVDWLHGNAMYYALSLDQMALPIGKWIYSFPLILKGCTYIALAIEWIAPILLLIPYRNNKLRIIGVILIVLLHIGISLTLFVGLFFLIGIVTAIGILPSKREVKPSPKLYQPLWIIGLNTTKYAFWMLAICYTLYLNITGLHIVGWVLEDAYTKPFTILQLQQKWGMFAPNVFKDDGWYVAEATLRNGKKVDLLAPDFKLSHKKPKNVLERIPNDRWRKLFENMCLIQYSWLRVYYCDYLIHFAGYPVDKLTLIYYGEFSEPNYKKATIQKFVLCE